VPDNRAAASRRAAAPHRKRKGCGPASIIAAQGNGRVGVAGDNAATESFFALLQNNVLDRRSWTTREELRIAIATWIERTYHSRSRQDRLGRLTPLEYETIMTNQAVQAA